jgi:ABC-type nitrate/sulfonate/bicarbonate transport system permease component
MMGANKKLLLLKVLFPWSLAYIITGIKLGLARGWRTLIAVEMIAASLWGLGVMIFDAREFLLTDIIYGGILIMAVIFFILEKTIIKFLEKNTIEKWRFLVKI